MDAADMSVKWDNRFLDLAEMVAGWSLDPSTQVGAVIVDPDNRIVSVGFNGFPRGISDDRERYLDRELKLKMVVHAENNAILFSQRNLDGCTLYTHPFMPCSRCAGMIIQSGISRVVTRRNTNPRWEEDFLTSEKMFFEAGITLEMYEPK